VWKYRIRPLRENLARQAYCEDDVIEAEWTGKVRRQEVAVVIDQQVIGINADLPQHGVEERGLILAIAISTRQHVLGSMRLISADANLDSDIANAVLHVVCQAADLHQRIRTAGCNPVRFVADGRSNLAPPQSQFRVPAADLRPRAVVNIRGCGRLGSKRQAELSGDRSPSGHL